MKYIGKVGNIRILLATVCNWNIVESGVNHLGFFFF